MTSSLSNSLGSVGGFCIGKKEVVYHQRLNAAGYVFSASSPPYLLMAASKALSLVSPALCARLAHNVATMRPLLSQLTVLRAHGHDESPIVHLRLAQTTGSRLDDSWLLQRISEEARKLGLAVPRARYVDGEKYQPPPSLRLCVSAAHERQHLELAIKLLEAASKAATDARATKQ